MPMSDHHRAARHAICSVAPCHRSCCGARALAGERQRAAPHTTGAAVGGTAGKRQLAPRRITSHSTKPAVAVRVANMFLPLEMQDELQSDGLGAALEETKAQVEKCSR